MRRLVKQIIVVGGVILLLWWLNSRHPVGENENAIWDAIVAHERFSSYTNDELRIVSWQKGPFAGDLAPTHVVRVAAGEELVRVECSAICVADGWKASVHSILPD